jgi:hypothetical protein
MGDRAATAQQITIVGCVQREAEYREAHAGGRGGTLGTGVGAGNEFVLTNAMPGSASASASTAPSGTMASGAGTTASGTTAGTTAGTTGTATGTATGTSAAGTATAGTSGHPAMTSGGTAYSLTGNREKELETLVGQKVEIVGTLENANRGSAGTGASTGYGTGSTTTGAGTTSSGTTATGTTAAGTTGSTASGTGTMSGSASASAGRMGDLQTINVVSFRAVGGSCTPQ